VSKAGGVVKACQAYAKSAPAASADARFFVQFDAAAVHYEVADVCPKEPMT
jgi:phage baseplate assembly protein gpV